jgi:drug/metabolite transporter (DMT)-like permease
MLGKIHNVKELALLLVLSTLWGASYTFIKIGVETIPPLTFIAARTFIASTILTGVLIMRGVRLPRDRQTWKRFLFQACLNSVIPFTMIAWAEQTINAGLATILGSTVPIFTFLLTLIVTRHESPTYRKLFGVTIGLIGTCLVVGIDAFNGLGNQLSAQLAIILATICYAGAAIFGRNFAKLDPILPAAGSMICGTIILIPASLVADHPWTLTPSIRSLFALLALSILSTALAFVIYFRLVQTLGSVGATAQAYLRVPIGVGIGALFLGENLSYVTWLGLACVVSGVLAMTLPARNKAETSKIEAQLPRRA